LITSCGYIETPSLLVLQYNPDFCFLKSTLCHKCSQFNWSCELSD